MIKTGDIITGVCTCHDVQVTGPAGTVAVPRPKIEYDFWTGKGTRVWHVVRPEGGLSHLIPIRIAKKVKA